MVTLLKNSNCDQTQKLIVTKLKHLNCDKTQKNLLLNIKKYFGKNNLTPQLNLQCTLGSVLRSRYVFSVMCSPFIFSPVLFCLVLFYLVMFCSVLFRLVLFYLILFCPVLFCPVPFCPVMFCQVVYGSVLFWLFHCITFVPCSAVFLLHMAPLDSATLTFTVLSSTV